MSEICIIVIGKNLDISTFNLSEVVSAMDCSTDLILVNPFVATKPLTQDSALLLQNFLTEVPHFVESDFIERQNFIPNFFEEKIKDEIGEFISKSKRLWFLKFIWGRPPPKYFVIYYGVFFYYF